MSHILPDRYIDLSNKSSKYQPKHQYNDWERNVIDEYKNLSNEEICAKVEAAQAPYAILMTHINIDYNLGSVLRIGNCLGAKVFYYGQKKFDKRSAVGAWHYSPITYLTSIDDVKKLKEEYSFVALEQAKNSVPLHKFTWSKNKPKTLIVVGEEARGLQQTPEIFELSDHIVEIPQKGSVRSLNAATSVAIAAYDFLFKNKYI